MPSTGTLEWSRKAALSLADNSAGEDSSFSLAANAELPPVEWRARAVGGVAPSSKRGAMKPAVPGDQRRRGGLVFLLGG